LSYSSAPGAPIACAPGVCILRTMKKSRGKYRKLQELEGGVHIENIVSNNGALFIQRHGMSQ